MTGFVFILSCGWYTSCTSNPPREEESYGTYKHPEVPFQPIKEKIEYLGGTVIYAGEQASLNDKLVYKEEVKRKIKENNEATGIFLFGHSFGTGANTIAAYEEIESEGNTFNLAGIVTLDSYLLTGNGEGINLGYNDNGELKDPLKYDTQYKADFVLNKVPYYTAHHAGYNNTTNFPNVGGLGDEFSTTHERLANSKESTRAMMKFIFDIVFNH